MVPRVLKMNIEWNNKAPVVAADVMKVSDPPREHRPMFESVRMSSKEP